MKGYKPIVMVGAGEFARITSSYLGGLVKGYAVEDNYLEKSICKPVFSLDSIQFLYPPSLYSSFIAVTFGRKCSNRARLFDKMRELGYKMINFVHSKAYFDGELGEGSFIFEHNVVQDGVKIGNNTTLWSGNHIGHLSEIGNHCFISSHVVMCQGVKVGDRVFIGVNTSIAPEIEIGSDSFIGMGCNITRDVPPNTIIIRKDSRDEVQKEGTNL